MADPEILLLCPEGPERDALIDGLSPRQELSAHTDWPQDFGRLDLLWLHRGPKDSLGELPEGVAQRVADWVRGGGRLLLTGAPAHWTEAFGFEERPPTLRVREWTGPLREQDRLGVAGFGTHPVFRRHPGGVYLRQPWSGCAMGGAFYVAGARPEQGRLLGVEKVFLGIEAETGLLVEHLPGEGRVLSLGAHLVFAHEGPGEDPFVENRLRFTVDMIDELLTGDIASDEQAKSYAWPARDVVLREGEPSPLELPERWPYADLDALRREGLELERVAGEEAFFDLPSREGVVAIGEGDEGIKEIWRLPVRLVSRFALLDAEGMPLRPQRTLVRPSSIERELGFGEHSLSEVLISPRGSGVLGGHLHADAGGVVQLEIHGDHRMHWPYPARALGAISWAFAAEGRLFSFADGAMGHAGLFAFSRTPSSHQCEEHGDGFVLRLRFDLEPGQPLGWLLGSGTSMTRAEDALRQVFAGELDPGSAALDALAERRDAMLQIETGNAELDHELAWCLAKGDEFFVETQAHEGAEALRGYVAGYQVTRPGWCSGRPGYAWFFGRDSLWFSRAMLPMGAAADVRDNLRLLARGQGPSGEIYHEWTPSGIVHYDAADATPMFVEMLGRYVDWTGDLDLGKELFGHVERALAFVEDRDRDGDGVTENTGVGHGWMEGGPLFDGVHAECYLASAQAAALRQGAALAKRLGKDALSREWLAQGQQVERVLAERFFDPELGRFAHAMRKDGSFDPSPSVLGAMPAVFEVASEPLAGESLVPFAASEFSADWGVRMLSSRDERYEPSSYQAGSAWPLFTGWVTLADFHSGRPGPAWERLTGLMSLVTRFHPGVVEEVYRGDVCAPIGVCPHQAWSHSAIFGSIALGLLGLGVAPGGDALRIAPCLPGRMDELRLRGLRFRDSVLDLTVHRDQDGQHLEMRLELREGEICCELAPFFPAPCRVDGVTVDGEDALFEREELLEGLRLRTHEIRLQAGQSRVVRFDVRPDLLLVERTIRPEENQQAAALRVLSRVALEGDSGLRLELEATPGHHSLPVRLPGRAPLRIEGAELNSGALRFRVDEPVAKATPVESRLAEGEDAGAAPAPRRYVRHVITLRYV
jgi:glycogen debranching enzyme